MLLFRQRGDARQRPGEQEKKKNVNKHTNNLCLIVLIVLVSFVLPHIWAKRKMIRSGGYDYKSGGGFCCFLIVLISFMAANVVISAAGR